MRAKESLITIFVSLAFCFCSSSAEESTVIARTEASVVRVAATDQDNRLIGMGSGFALGDGTVIATNLHVIENADRVLVIGKGANAKPYRIDGKVVWSSREYDLAFVKIGKGYMTGLNLSTQILQKGEKIYALGYPGAADMAFVGALDPSIISEATLTNGSVGRGFKGRWDSNGVSVSIIQHSAPINSGNSGGPLFDACGRVVGINTAKAVSFIDRDQVDATTGIFFASGADVIVSGAETARINVSVQSSPCEITEPAGSRNSLAKTDSDQRNIFISAFAAVSALIAMIIAFRYARLFPDRGGNYSEFREISDPEKSQRFPECTFSLEGNDLNGDRLSLHLETFGEDVARVVYLGRSRSHASLLIPDKSVSRKHLKIEHRGNAFLITDCHSKNGTEINGKKVGDKPTRLSVGDELKVGQVKLVLKRRIL